MYKLKRRFKKALFYFFEEEVKESIGFNSSFPKIHSQHNLFSKDVRLQQLRAEIQLPDISEIRRFGREFNYEKELDKCKKELFNEVMKFVHIEEQELVSPEIWGGRRVLMSLFVGKVNK